MPSHLFFYGFDILCLIVIYKTVTKFLQYKQLQSTEKLILSVSVGGLLAFILYVVLSVLIFLFFNYIIFDAKITLASLNSDNQTTSSLAFMYVSAAINYPLLFVCTKAVRNFLKKRCQPEITLCSSMAILSGLLLVQAVIHLGNLAENIRI